ncbi:dehydrogenase [Salmonella enterica subsp. enterica serovar Choleraesuis]|nr:dehydrogenase [Salmonella enterica subsp. enterica serovar Choleraesuis]
MSTQNGITRREAVIKVAGGLVALSLLPYTQITFAQRQQAVDQPVAWSQFYQVSQTLTDRSALDPALSARYFLALTHCFPDFATQLTQLNQLRSEHHDGQSLFDAAQLAGLSEITTHILSAWYTGSAGPSDSAEYVLVAYRDALMYQTVSDALVIPTWCSKGPLWWLDLPPGVTREPSVPALDPPQSLLP